MSHEYVSNRPVCHLFLKPQTHNGISVAKRNHAQLFRNFRPSSSILYSVLESENRTARPRMTTGSFVDGVSWMCSLSLVDTSSRTLQRFARMQNAIGESQ
jgi:hypothetical protein